MLILYNRKACIACYIARAKHIYTRIYPHGETDTDTFAENVTTAMNKAIYHPDLQALATCEVKRNSSTSFDGYELKYDKAYLRIAREWGKLSHCERKKVGIILFILKKNFFN